MKIKKMSKISLSWADEFRKLVRKGSLTERQVIVQYLHYCERQERELAEEFKKRAKNRGEQIEQEIHGIKP